MPLEIKELVIRATIDSDAGGKTESSKKEEVDRDDVVAECVEQVMRILRRERER